MKLRPILVLAVWLPPLLAVGAPASSMALAQEPSTLPQARLKPQKAGSGAPATSAAKTRALPGASRAVQGPAGPAGARDRAAVRAGPGKGPAPAVPAGEDQSFLYSDYSKAPPDSAGAPDYVTSGSSHFNQPWFMSIYDKLGNWPP